MSLRRQAKLGVPTETKGVAEATFPRGNVYLAMHAEATLDWVLAHPDGAWVKRDGHRVEGGQLGQTPTERPAWADLVASGVYTEQSV